MDDDKIVNLNEVIKRIAVLSDVDEETSREFMQAFSRVLVDALLKKDSIDIRAIGRFSEDEHTPGVVKFEASLPLASVVNRPFSCFDPVEIDDEDDVEVKDVDAPETEVSSVETSAEDIDSEPEVADAEPENGALLPDESEIVSDHVESPCEHEEAVSVSEQSAIAGNEEAEIEAEAEVEPATVKIDDSKPLQVEIVGGEESKKHHPLIGWIFSFGVVIGLCAGFIAGILLYDYIYPVSKRDYIADDVDIDEIEVVEEGSAAIVPSDLDSAKDTVSLPAEPVSIPQQQAEKQVSSNIVTDTVGAGRFLATMARKHYGSYVFWVYIYEENRDKIADPDNVAVGTVVVIPDASKYGIDAKSPESIKRARAKAAEIAGAKRK